jgi:hypothetical protein
LSGKQLSKEFVMKNKTIIICLLCVFSPKLISTQQLFVAKGGAIYISSASNLYVESDITIDDDGKLTVVSNETNSGSLIVKGEAEGNITYNRHIPTNNFHFVSAPVKTQDIGAFVSNNANDIQLSASGKYSIAKYENTNPSGKRWEYYTEASGTLAASSAGNFIQGKGYSILRGEAGIYSFNGEMSTEYVALAIPASTEHRWSVVGNPYTSFLPLNNGSNADNNILKQNLENLEPSKAALYFWDGASYKPINHAHEAFYLPPGQAFMVHPKSDYTVFEFPKDLQTIQTKTRATFKKKKAVPQIIISLQSGDETKETVLKYFENTTTGLDIGYDAGAFTDVIPPFAIYTHLVTDSEGINYSLQCLPNTNYEASIVPLSIASAANKTLNFSVLTLNLPLGLNVFLEDRDNNTFTDISTTSHQVTLTNSLEGIGRFYLHTAESVLAIEEEQAMNSFNMYKTSNTNLRISGLQQNINAVVKIYTLIGEEVLSLSFKVIGLNDIKLPSNLASGVYLVQLATSGRRQIKKLIIEN